MTQEPVPNESLKEARLEKCWTLAVAAEKANVSIGAYSRWEYGTQVPRLSSLKLLCDAFGKTAEELGFGFLVKKKPLAEEQRDHSQQQEAPSADFMTLTQEEAVPGELEREKDISQASPSSMSLDTSVFVSSANGILVPSSAMTQTSLEIGDWATWFALKQAQMFTTISLWNGRALFCNELQLIIDQEIKMFDEMKPQDNNEAYILSRRQAIIAIAAFPTVILNSVQQGFPSTLMTEELLSRCAASITACWHLLKGSEFYIIEHIVSMYLNTLVTLAQQPSRYQKTSARLVTQGYRLKGIVALHQNNLKAREACCEWAVYYSEIAEDSSLLVSALISLASTFYYSKDPTKAMYIYQKALFHTNKISPLQQSRVFVELAVVYAQQGQEHEALHYMDLARSAYPEHPEQDPSALYAEFSPASMILEEGLTHLALAKSYPERGYGKMAWNAFAQIETHRWKGPVPERIFFEITNHQAETALALGNQELLRSYLEKGVQGANKLNSKQRRREAVEVYKQARNIWPHDSNIKELADLFL